MKILPAAQTDRSRFRSHVSMLPCFRSEEQTITAMNQRGRKTIGEVFAVQFFARALSGASALRVLSGQDRHHPLYPRRASPFRGAAAGLACMPRMNAVHCLQARLD